MRIEKLFVQILISPYGRKSCIKINSRASKSNTVVRKKMKKRNFETEGNQIRFQRNLITVAEISRKEKRERRRTQR